MNKKEFLNKFDFNKSVNRGENIYKKNKSKYEETGKGKYLAIDPESKDIYLDETLFGVLMSARQVHPNALLYIVKIGCNTARIDLSIKITTEK